MRVLTAFFITICLICNPIIDISAQSENVIGYKYQEALATLSVIGIAAFTQDEMEDNITKADFAVMVAKLINANQFENSSLTVTDVPTSHIAANEIYSLLAKGIIKLDSLGNFYPNEAITISEASEIVINALGFGNYVEANDKELKSKNKQIAYISIAIEKGILSGISKTVNDDLTKSEAVLMVFNALDADILRLTNISGKGNTYTTNKGITALTEYHSIIKSEGRITGNEFLRLNGSGGIKKSQVEIDGVIYDKSSSIPDLTNYIGVNVRFYYKVDKGNDLKTLLFVYPDVSSENLIIIPTENISSYNNYELKYYDSNNRVQTAKIKKPPYFIYNNTILKSFNEQSFKQLPGTITLIKMDNSDVFDLVNVKSYSDYLVSAVAISDNEIFNKYYPTTSMVLDSNNSSNKTRIINTEGKELTIKNIKKNDVLSVFTSGNSTNVIVSSKKISGVVAEIDSNLHNTNDVSTINIKFKNQDSYYKIARSYLLATPTRRIPNPGDQIICYLNFEGDIAGIDYENSPDNSFGYLVTGSIKKAIDNKYQVAILTNAGDVSIFDLSKNVNIIEWVNGVTANSYIKKDAIKYSDEQTFNKLININSMKKYYWFKYMGKTTAPSSNDLATITDTNVQTVFNNGVYILNQDVIRYSLNDDNQISKIEISTPDVATNINTDGLYLQTSNTSLRYKSGPKSFFGQFMIDNSTIVFCVPLEAPNTVAPVMINSNDFIKYSVKSINYLTSDTYYSVRSYNTIKNKMISEAVVIYDNQIIDESTYFFLVEGKTEAIDNEGNKIYKINGFSKGEKTSLISDLETKFSKYNNGDIFTYSLGPKQYVSNILDFYVDGVFNPQGTTTYENIRRVIKGKVLNKEGNIIKVETDSTNHLFEIHDISTAKIYIYDSNKERNNISIGSANDLISEMYSNYDSASTIILRARYATATELIILK